LPAPGPALLAALHASGGSVVAVSEEQIAAGVRHFGRAGFAVEPTSAVVWAGVEHLLAGGAVRGPVPVVAVISGHGLKAVPAISQLLN
jgi:threonine synthase